MPSTKSRAKAGERIAFLRWLWWETVRRHPGYRYDVAVLLRGLRRQLRRPPPDVPVYEGADHSTHDALKGIHSSDIDTLSHLSERPRELTSEEAARSTLAAYQSLIGATRGSLPFARTPELDRCLADGILFSLPMVVAFQGKWGLRFPVPPRMHQAPESLMASRVTHPVEILEEQGAQLVLKIWRPAGLAALDHVAGVLDHFQSHRWPTLPPQPALERIVQAVRSLFGDSAADAEGRIDKAVAQYRNELARQAGYTSYARLGRRATQSNGGPDQEEQERSEDAAMESLLASAAMAPRKARKGRSSRVEHSSDQDWLRVTIMDPDRVEFADLVKLLTPRLPRAALNLRPGDRHAYVRVFKALDLGRRGWGRQQIALALNLDDDQARGQERVTKLRHGYQTLVQRLCLPPLASRR